MDELLNKYNLNSVQLSQFKKYYDFLIEENNKINLTAIVEETEAYIKHFYDSMLLSDYIELENKSLCDIGSGAGFPSIPLKILVPSIKITIIEPTLKRIKFLESLVSLLDLKDVTLINGRAEDEIVNRRESFDIVTARAVASLPILLELCVPYVKVNGVFASLKGYSYQEELDSSKNAIKVLCLETKVNEYDLPLDMGKRSIIVFTKKQKTNKIYPRKYAMIKKKPL